MTEVFSQGPCGVLKNQNNLSNNGHSERAEMHRHHRLVLMEDQALKINVAKTRFFWCISLVKGTLLKIDSPGNFLLASAIYSKNPQIRTCNFFRLSLAWFLIEIVHK